MDRLWTELSKNLWPLLQWEPEVHFMNTKTYIYKGREHRNSLSPAASITALSKGRLVIARYWRGSVEVFRKWCHVIRLLAKHANNFLFGITSVASSVFFEKGESKLFFQLNTLASKELIWLQCSLFFLSETCYYLFPMAQCENNQLIYVYSTLVLAFDVGLFIRLLCKTLLFSHV